VPFDIPEAVFMLCDTILVFDHIYQTLKVVSHIYVPDCDDSTESLSKLYDAAHFKIQRLIEVLENPEVPLPHQPPIKLGNQAVSNVGKKGYEGFVTKLKEHIVKGDIIQAVPSQRLSRPTSLHPFNLYRQLRQVNPSPYMFYLDCDEVQLVGASPETLCKVENRKVYNHAIAGTVKRGKTAKGEYFPQFPDVSLGLTLTYHHPRRGRGTRQRPARKRKGPSRTHHVGRSGEERRQPGLQARDCQGGRIDEGGKVQSRNPPHESD
jgi:hypothetical protein